MSGLDSSDGLARWFVAETRMDWAHVQARNPELARQLEMLSAFLMANILMTNIRDLLQATSVSSGVLHPDSPESPPHSH
ncbi:MAG: hypothetical protein KAW49_02080 [Anaerolineae bacterium]|nr:hypothetical protein [Anaerolineae bacterium]